MCRRSRNCFDRCDQVAPGDFEFAEQRREVYREWNDHAIGVSPKKPGGGLDRDPGPGYRDRHCEIGPFKPVPEFWSGQSHDFHKIWRNGTWAGVEPKDMWTDGGRHHRHERDWSRFVLYDPGARLDE